MAENLTKLRPDRDLQCYFQRPSAIAALSDTSLSGFTVSGTWRDPFDWAVVEWNRDNVFEHPALRNLPDGDLSGLRLSYRERRSNCIAMDSSLYPVVAWPYLRLWAEDGGAERLYNIPLQSYATPSIGQYAPATATFELQGSITEGDYIELAWLDQHFNRKMIAGESLATGLAGLANAINQSGDGSVTASTSGSQITLSYSAAVGANACRIGVYGTVHGASTETWSPNWAQFSGGTSPDEWLVELDFGALEGYVDPDRSQLVPIPTSSVRKLRWTWAADQQAGDFQRSEFSVVVSDWSVTGERLEYRVAGPGSRRIESQSSAVTYVPADRWSEARGNYSGGAIRWTTAAGSSLSCSYTSTLDHTLYLGTRYAEGGAHISVQVDGRAPQPVNLAVRGEDVLVRVPLGPQSGRVEHTITITHDGTEGPRFYFDFLEIAVETTELPEFATSPRTTLATDWDTDHSIALAPERTAWMIQKLGFRGRSNHYAGALWFYELCRPGHQFASAVVEFSGNPEWGKITSVSLGDSSIQHLNLIGETAETLARCFALLVNAGTNSVWATADGPRVTVTARNLGTAGNGLSISATTDNSPSNPIPLTAMTSMPALSGGIDGACADPNGTYWRTDLTALPRINRAARDWSRSFFAALHGYGIESTAAFSMELQHGDDSTAAGIAQRYPNGDAAWLTTPALQTNFGPASTAFWQQVHADMASVMCEAGVTPYLQFGEVQWWYFPGPTASVATKPGMPLYDSYTTSQFKAAHGREMAMIPNQYAEPAGLSAECAFLPGLIGAFTKRVRDYVHSSLPQTRFEVLYPPDVNDTPLNRLINFPADDWTPSEFDCLKTENFSYTFERDLDKATDSINLPAEHGFPPSQSSHLVGIGDYTTPWIREAQLAEGARLESVVLFALDQFCLIGYQLPLRRGVRRSRYMGV